MSYPAPASEGSSLKLSQPRSAWSVPGKVFILGEYAVLTGAPAVLASVGPRFEWRPAAGVRRAEFPVESPVGRFIRWSELRPNPRLEFMSSDFVDPRAGLGGFGASTAQFALAYAAWAETLDDSVPTLIEKKVRENAWSFYRELTAEEPTPPSGADLAVQLCGGLACFEWGKTRELHLPAGACLVVFSAVEQVGRKVRTHEHLSRLRAPDCYAAALADPLQLGLSAFEIGDAVLLGRAMAEYAESLFRLGLEIQATGADRLALSQISGVFGVKGAGALQADAVIALCRPEARGALVRMAVARGLVLVCDDAGREAGLSVEIPK